MPIPQYQYKLMGFKISSSLNDGHVTDNLSGVGGCFILVCWLGLSEGMHVARMIIGNLFSLSLIVKITMS